MMMNSIQKKSNPDINSQHKLFQRYFNKAVRYQAQNNVKLAIELYDKALQYNNKHLPTLQAMGLLLQQSGHYGKALHYYTRASEIHNHSATIENALGLCYEHCLQWQTAREHFTTAIELRQDYAEALNNLGNICRKMEDYQQAEFNLLRSLRLCINIPTLINLGLLMTEMHNYSQAHSFFDHALRLQPFNNQIKWHKALLLLTEGEFKQGWELYTSSNQETMNLNSLNDDVPTIKASSTSHEMKLNFQNKSVYIRGKQSIFDEIMFASCLHEIVNQTKECFIECDDRLVSLFQRSFDHAEIIAKSESHLTHQVANPKKIDIHISMVDIAKVLRQSFNDFPSQQSYLVSSKTATTRWQQKYTQYSSNMKIGVAWRSNATDETSNNCCSLKHWEIIFSGCQSQIINLQYGQIESEIDDFNQAILDWPNTDHQHNIEQLAAQITALDLVITTNNLVAHLSGALGKEVWIILPYAANWRWFNGKNPCPWYSNAKIFKQKTPGDWQNLFVDINKNLLSLTHTFQNEKAEPALQLISSSLS